jgi:thioredoxin reductase
MAGETHSQGAGPRIAAAPVANAAPAAKAAPAGGAATATAAERPFPPGEYPIVVVGSGPGGLQVSYALRRLGVEHAVLSADPEPGGMFRRFPFFQRLLSWTKPYAPVAVGTRAYERYDWNSLLAEEPENRALQVGIMDGTSYFPSRPEMERNLAAFAEKTGTAVRYGCRWESTRREETPSGDRFVLTTSDGEYRCRVAVFAVGVAEPYTPSTPGMELSAHYVDTRPAETYAGKRIFIIGKQNSGFELANGLLQWARGIVLASPSPAKLSVVTRSLVGIRARYLQPYEDHVLAGGVSVLEASIAGIERAGDGGTLRVTVQPSAGGEPVSFEVDEVIAATGFVAPLRDLPALGVATFGSSRLPAQTPFWESATVPGIYFAGTIGQGAGGLKKHGMPSNSGAVQGARYNARLLAGHIAEANFGVTLPAPGLEQAAVLPFLLDEICRAPELWHQRAYLARVVTFDPDRGIADAGIVPLAHFLDSGGPDAVAATIEVDADGALYPVVYARHAGSGSGAGGSASGGQHGRVVEHVLPGHPLHDFGTPEHARALASVLAGFGVESAASAKVST